MKEMKNPLHTKRKHLIILISFLALMLGFTGETWAATNVYWDQANGSNSNSGLSASKPLKTWTAAKNLWAEKNPDGGGWVYMMSPRTITTGDGTFDGSTSSGNMRIRRYTTLSGPMFICPMDTHLRFANMVIDGRTTFNTTYVAHSGIVDQGPAGEIIEAKGQVTITNCTLQRNNGRCITANNDGTAIKDFTLTNVTIRACIASAGSAILFSGPDYHNAVLTGCTISGCYCTEGSYGGTIRENGSTKTHLTLTNCDINNNKSACGGAVFWNASGRTDAICTINGTTKIHDNIALKMGGGVHAESTVKIQGNVQIYNNIAQFGGGVYLRPYWGGAAAFNGTAYDVTIQDNVKIYNNKASQCGGGIFAYIYNSPDIGFNASGGAISPHYKLTVSSGEIYNNQAPLGAGIGVWDVAPKINKTAEGTSGEIKRTIAVTGGKIYNNETTAVTAPSKNDPEDRGLLEFSRAGAGIYIRKYKRAHNTTQESTTVNNMPSQYYPNEYNGDAGTITVNISGGETYNNKATSGYGGGFYINNEFYGNSSISSACNVNVSGTAQVFGNTCGYDGAGIYLKGGAFTMTGGTIGKSPLASNGNRAGRDGGGFFVDSGTCKVQGGTVSYNQATGNGGGFYVDPGSGTTTNINSSSATTTVSYNQAVNGAGAYVKTGTLAVATAATTINNNTASTSGGGVYVAGGTVTVNNATLASNTAGTHGGGIYSSSGSVTLTSAQVNSNTATGGNGGGVYAGSTVTVTSATLSGNTATNNNNGKGGGIYATATVGISGTSSALSNLTSNQARLGGGVYADNTSVTIGYANIGNSGVGNSATADGGGVYAAGTVTLNTGAAVQSNTASNDGGGVYVNNATFTMNASTTVGGSSAAYGNSATGGNGGGVYITGNSAKVQVLGGTIGYNTAPSTTSGKGNGGGIYVASSHTDGTSISGGAKVSYNTAKNNGGGIYVVSGKVSLAGTSSSSLTSVIFNEAENANGGGVYLGGGEFILGACSTIGSNSADNGNGGGVFVGGTSPIYRQNGDDHSLVEYNTANNGAGLYMGGGTCYLSAGYIHANTADVNGGGIYMGGGTFQHSGGEIGNQYSEPNQAVNGGGLYVNGGDYYSTSVAAWINGNKATSNGGGIYMNGGNCYMQGGHVGYNGASQLNSAVNGAGLYMAGTGHFEMTSSSSEIRGNHASGNGGGIYMEGGTCDITAGNIGVSGSINQAVNGGGIYAAGGTITVNGGNINYNTATNTAGTAGDGGGIYSNAGSVTVSNGNITYNTAVANGGGIYAKGTVGFSNGNIKNNAATTANGGGVYIHSTGRLNVSGTAEISANTVQSGWGGGVYQGGTMYADGSSFKVINNTRNGSKATENNNVYLPDGQTVEVGPHISTSVDLGVYTENIATVGNLIPVLTTVENGSSNKLPDIYNAMLTGTSNIHDDRHLHQPIYVGDDPTGHTLYFGFIEFDYPAYTEDFSNPIDSRAKLYQFMCWVNGVNGYADAHPGAAGNVTADIDASNFILWIPIGEANMIGATYPYTGTFTGNGHVIDGLGLTDELYSNYGLFGSTAGATIDGVYLTNCEFEKNTAGAIGCIVGHMQGGSLTNSTCSGTLTAAHADCIAGGLVGKFEKNGSANGTIHSSYAGTDQTGYQMGGLVGDLAAGCSIYNSYANASFSPQSGSTNYIGGLVGINKGTVENCYSRVRGTIPSATYFGWLAGDNTNGSLVSSYIPTSASTQYTASGKTGTQTSLNNYDPVIAPYLYYTAGDNAVGNSTLLDMLNGWVDGHSGYAPWRRTTAGGTAYSATAGDINGDYPIHQYANTDCVSASGTNALAIDYTSTLTAMLKRHTSYATLNLYDHDETDEETGTGVVIYIDENISLLQSDDTKDIAAYTCQTLPGSPRSWHFLSSSLQDSYIGFNYDHYSTFNWDPDPCGLTFSSANDFAIYPSDMPAVSSMDFYAFYEPEYHWINLKRRSDSHWHMNEPTVPIAYTNETTMTPGKGYLVSIDQNQLLQNRGTLNNGDVEIALCYTPHNEWAGLLGYNLIGNPYQSYLDFSRFASANSSLWYDSSKGYVEPTYAVYDGAMGGYVQYKEGASRGAKSASGMLNMHQGFIIKTSGTTLATFTNAMRSNHGNGTTFRDDQPAFPLINLTVTDDEGVNDFAVLELDRAADEGAEKLRANDSKGWLYLRYDGENYGILFRTEVEDYQPLWFEADEAGTYTLSWETANAEFETLTLIDNITGVTTDMLERDSYTFEATPEQYASRFKIVIGDYKDVDENEAPEPVEGPAFAFQMGDEIVVNGEGRLEIIDVTGRVLQATTLYGSQSRVGKPAAAAGVYVLRLTDGTGTQVQKMVIE